MNHFLVGHVGQIGLALSDESFDVVVGNLAVGLGSSYHRFGAIRAETDAADGNHGVSYGQAGNFFQRFYGRENCFGSVFKAGDVASYDSLGFFLGGRQYVQRAVLFSLNNNSPYRRAADIKAGDDIASHIMLILYNNSGKLVI